MMKASHRESLSVILRRVGMRAFETEPAWRLHSSNIMWHIPGIYLDEWVSHLSVVRAKCCATPSCGIGEPLGVEGESSSPEDNMRRACAS